MKNMETEESAEFIVESLKEFMEDTLTFEALEVAYDDPEHCDTIPCVYTVPCVYGVVQWLDEEVENER